MTAILASSITRYGAPIDFQGSSEKVTDPAFLFVGFVKYTTTLWVDIGSPADYIPYCFVAIYVMVGGRHVGLLPYPDASSSDDEGSGEV